MQLALVVLEADQALIDWTRTHQLVVIDTQTSDERIGRADRELHCSRLVLSRSGTDLEDPIFDLYAISRPFATKPASNVEHYPLPIAAAYVYTASLTPIQDQQLIATALASDANEHRGTYEASSLRGAPLVVSTVTALEREAAS